MMIIAIVFMLAALAVMIRGARRKDRVGNIAALAAFPVLLLGVVMMFRQGNENDFVTRDSNYYATQAARIGSELKKSGIGGKAELLVLESDMQSPEVEAFRRVLEEFGTFEKITLHPLRLSNPAAPRISDRMDPQEFKTICSEIPEDAVIISLAGVPADFRKLGLFRRKSSRRFIAVCPEVVPIGAELSDGRIFAAVIPREDAVFSDRPVADYLKAFDERYLYVAGKI